ncbi:uncharacterized protein isoform X1 [Choristoneura fumiferana]|uniref:uncharacterized protein isoform X1 n=1 Tax=Choristoneura fumiferana TaxID=7141 RepID=UPI003D1555DB
MKFQMLLVLCVLVSCLVRVRGGPLTRGHVANRGREGRKVPSRLPFLVRLPPSTTPCQQRICFGRMQTRLPFLALPQELQTTTQPPALPKLALVVYESEPSRLPGLVRCPAVKQTTHMAGRGRRAKDLPVIGRISNSSDFYNSDISDFSDMGNISGDEFHSNTNISGIARTNDIANIGSVANTSDAGNMSYTGDSDVDFLLKIANDKKSDNTGDSDDDFLDNNAVIDNTMISSKITKTSGNKVANRDGQHEVTLPFESDFDDNHENFSPLHEEIHSSTYKYKKWEDFFGNHTTIPTTAEITRPSSCPYYKTSSTAAPTKMGMPHHAYKQYDATEAPCLDYYNPIYDLVMTMCGHDFTDDTDLTCRERFLNVGPNAPRSYDPSFGYY